MIAQPIDDWRSSSVMDAHLLKEKSSAYRSLVNPGDGLPIFDCMYRQNLAQIVLVAKEVLKRSARMPLVAKLEKKEESSEKFRLEGNKAFALSQYQNALVQYNKALCHAPNESRSLKIAYANRSAVLHKLEAYGEAMADIDLVMRLGCPPDVVNKLKERHRVCRTAGWIKKLSDDAIPDIHNLGKFFELTSINPQINTATLDVGVAVTENGKKVVAAKHINPGSLVILESAYVSQTNDLHKYLACSFCHKLALNLMPCRHCCDTLFCSPVCMELAIKEYHEIECHLSEVLRNTSTECRMALKAVVRMKTMALDWDGMITHSSYLGKQRLIRTSIQEVFNENNPFTILCADIDKPFVHGTIYNLALDCAVVMYYFEKLPSFFPTEDWRKNVAVECVSHIMMHLCVHHAHTQMQVVVGKKGEIPYAHEARNYGWFPLISKLRNSCSPNLVALALNKEMALVAVQPIELGDELTVAYLGHWLDNPMSPRNRQKTMFSLTGTMCRCRMCVRRLPSEPYALSEKQMKNWQRLNIESLSGPITGERVDFVYERVCKALDIFVDLPFSAEYAAIYRVFRRCLEFYQAMRYPQHLPLDLAE